MDKLPVDIQEKIIEKLDIDAEIKELADLYQRYINDEENKEQIIELINQLNKDLIRDGKKERFDLSIPINELIQQIENFQDEYEDYNVVDILNILRNLKKYNIDNELIDKFRKQILKKANTQSISYIGKIKNLDLLKADLETIKAKYYLTNFNLDSYLKTNYKTKYELFQNVLEHLKTKILLSGGNKLRIKKVIRKY